MESLRGLIHSRDGVGVIVLDDEAGEIWLRFGLVEVENGQHVLPDLVVDDWGREIRGTRLFAWIREHGQQFPRAEVFGQGADGKPTQRFLRELDLYARYPCYALPMVDGPTSSSVLIQAIVVTDPSVKEPQSIEKPSGFTNLLNTADVDWLAANTEDHGQIEELLIQLVEHAD